MLEAGYASCDIVPDGELHLVGVYARRPRVGACHRDPLMARALALRQGERRLVIVSADLLCISEELHQAVAEALPSLGNQDLLVVATHTHSSFGGYFLSRAAERMLGTPRPEFFEFLVERLSLLAREALEDLSPARASWGEGTVPGLVSSRRQANGPHDDRVLLLRLVREERKPIDVINASGHPVVVSEHQRETVSADYPGELCRRLEEAGIAPLFLSAALGGVSILFPEFKMDLDRHLELVGSLLLQGHGLAARTLQPVSSGTLEVDGLHLPHGRHRSRVFSGLGRSGRLLDGMLQLPLGRLARTMARSLPLPEGVPVHLVRLGNFCLVGSGAELGVTVVDAIRGACARKGIACAMVASLANAYAGYIHMSHVYRRWPEKGYRFLALYENALAMFGHDLGDRIVQAVEDRLGAGGSAGST